MKSFLRYHAPASPCSYLNDQASRLEYEIVSSMTAAEYAERLLQGWRRFGRTLFRPRCPSCSACQSLRIDVAQFQPNRSQRRTRRANAQVVRREIGAPMVSPANLDLYRRYHEFQAEAKGWHPADEDEDSYFQSFVDHPFPTEEWRYRCNGTLAGVSYVDSLPIGLSAIYFFYDPDFRSLSLGTWNILSLLDEAAARRLPHVYLGYYVDRCGSLSYKANFVPNETLAQDGTWSAFRS